MWIITFQTIAAGIIAGVGMAWIAYAVGVDRALVVAIEVSARVVGFVIMHPLQSVELIIAVPMSWLPTPRHVYQSRHQVRAA